MTYQAVKFLLLDMFDETSFPFSTLHKPSSTTYSFLLDQNSILDHPHHRYHYLNDLANIGPKSHDAPHSSVAQTPQVQQSSSTGPPLNTPQKSPLQPPTNTPRTWTPLPPPNSPILQPNFSSTHSTPLARSPTPYVPPPPRTGPSSSSPVARPSPGPAAPFVPTHRMTTRSQHGIVKPN